MAEKFTMTDFFWQKNRQFNRVGKTVRCASALEFISWHILVVQTIRRKYYEF
jgi:hypothetical protein